MVPIHTVGGVMAMRSAPKPSRGGSALHPCVQINKPEDGEQMHLEELSD